MKGKKFVRRVTHRHSKLGKGRKSLQKWRRPTGRDNKMRDNRKGRPPRVKIGYKKNTEERQSFRVITNLKEAIATKKGEMVVIGNVGNKKRIEIVENLKKLGAKIQNLNVKKFMKHTEAKAKKKKPETKTEEKKK